MAFVAILCAIVAICLAAIYHRIRYLNFWKRLGVVGPKPEFFYGNFRDLASGKISITNYAHNVYTKYENEPAVGLFVAKPTLLLKDLDAIREVLITYFSKFADRDIGIYEKTEPMSMNLVNLQPEKWRALRTKFNSAFSPGKIKDTYPLLLDCSKHFERYLKEAVSKGGPVDIRAVTLKYSTDVICAYAFGIDTNALGREDVELRRKADQMFEMSYENTIRHRMRQYVPWLYKILGYFVAEKKIAPFFTKIIKDLIQYRQENNIVKPDFVDVLIKLKEHPEWVPDIELTDTFLAAQVALFFSAGAETSSWTINNALFELAHNHEVQDKLRKEIMEQCGEKEFPTFDTVRQMKYLNKVFEETLRMYPVLVKLQRGVLEDHTFKSINLTVPKGVTIWIPQYSIQRDPKYYPNPDVFDPERFSESEIAGRHPMSYIPFGDGPRNCIGKRFAYYQTKVGIITVLRNYKVDVCEKTFSYEIDTHTIFLVPIHGIYLKLTKINN